MLTEVGHATNEGFGRTGFEIILPYFSSLGRTIGRKTHGETWEKQNQVRIVKFGEYCFRIIYHSLICAYGLWFFRNENWMARGEGWLNFTGSSHFFQQWPMHPVSPATAWYYLLQGAYNVDAMLSLLELSFTVEFQSPFTLTKTSTRDPPTFIPLRAPIRIGWSKTVRGDFQEMALHHAVTNILVFSSARLRFTRIGCAVFLVHDISDVPVDLCKLANFVKWKVATIACFFLMVATWLVTRLYLLPFTILRSIVMEASQNLTAHPLTVVCIQSCFSFLIGSLVVLHSIWFLMFVKMLLVLVRSNECHDLSEHKKGEAHHQPNVSSKKEC